MVSTAKLYMLVPIKLKINKSLKLLLAHMKANSSILIRLEKAGMTQNKQKCLIFIVVPLVRVKDLNYLAIKRTINLYEVNI